LSSRTNPRRARRSLPPEGAPSDRDDEPRAPGDPRHVLFVCSRNLWRSPTAERVWRDHPGLLVRSAGTSASARRRVSDADLRWADLVLVMEDKHRARLRADFPGVRAPIEVLDIPDLYPFMDPELVRLLEEVVPQHLPAAP